MHEGSVKGGRPTSSGNRGKRAPKSVCRIVGFSALGFLAGACAELGDAVDRYLNGVGKSSSMLSPVSDVDARFHKRLFIADAHADTLLWNRDIIKGSDWGHVDLPKLIRGNVRLQIFAVVTDTPNEVGGCVSARRINMSSLLAFASGKPSKARSSLKALAFYQAQRLQEFEERSAGTGVSLRVVRNLSDLQFVMDAWRDEQAGRSVQPVIGAVLGIEGAHWLGEVYPAGRSLNDDLDELAAVGFRVVALTHRFNNGLSGASEGCGSRAGLTPAGEAALDGLVQRRIVVDLAHISNEGLRQALEKPVPPPLISHTGVRATYDSQRNISDDDIRAVARRDGVIGVGYWPEAVGGSEANTFDEQMEAIIQAVSATINALSSEDFVREMDEKRRSEGARPYDPYEHVGFGSDFDGAVWTPIDAGGLEQITSRLRRLNNMSDAKLRLVAGLNTCRVLATVLSGTDANAAASICRVQ